MVNNGYAIQVNYAGDSHIIVDGQRYMLQFHFHSPSEEQVNGSHFDMVGHLVHAGDKGELAVVAAFRCFFKLAVLLTAKAAPTASSSAVRSLRAVSSACSALSERPMSERPRPRSRISRVAASRQLSFPLQA